MKSSLLSRAVAGFATLALVAAVSVAPSYAVTTFTASATGLTAGSDTITVTAADGSSFTGVTGVSTATIKKLDGTAAGTTTLTYNASTAGTLVLNVVTADLVNNTAYTVAFVTSGVVVTGAVELDVGTPTSTQVTVTATVEPILTMALGGNTGAAFGTLIPGTVKAAGTTVTPDSATATTITINTNSVGGYTLKSAAANFHDAVSNTDIAQIPSAVGGQNAATIISAGTSQWGIATTAVNGNTFGGVAATTPTLITPASTNAITDSSKVAPAGTTGSETTVATNAQPVASQVVSVGYWTNVDPTQPAGNYSTTVTYTTTANF